MPGLGHFAPRHHDADHRDTPTCGGTVAPVAMFGSGSGTEDEEYASQVVTNEDARVIMVLARAEAPLPRRTRCFEGGNARPYTKGRG